MNQGEVLRNERSIEGCYFADCLPAVEETAGYMIEGTQADESIVLSYLLCSGMSGIVAYFLYCAHILYQFPVFVDERIYFRAFEHLAECFVGFQRHLRHSQMVLDEPFQSLAGIGGTIFGECLLKDFCLIAVCV